jgi:hypothetical protein
MTTDFIDNDDNDFDFGGYWNESTSQTELGFVGTFLGSNNVDNKNVGGSETPSKKQLLLVSSIACSFLGECIHNQQSSIKSQESRTPSQIMGTETTDSTTVSE